MHASVGGGLSSKDYLDFNEAIMSKTSAVESPVAEILSLSKILIKNGMEELESKIESSNNQMKLKENELSVARERLDRAYGDMKRQMAQLDESAAGDSVLSSPSPIRQKISPGIGIGPGSSAIQTPSKWKEVSEIVSSLTPAAKDVAKLHSDMLKKQRAFDDLQEEHADLLSLLAQQELELHVFKSTMSKLSGSGAVRTTISEARRAAIEKYGLYTEFRSDE